MQGTGLKKETAAALSYILGPITGIIFLILEKDPYVRFHAMQSTVALGGLTVLSVFLGWLPIIGGLIWIASVIVLLVGAYQASQGKEFEFPIAGQIARKLLAR